MALCHDDALIAHIWYHAEVLNDCAHDTGLFPRLATCCLVGRLFVQLPTTLGQDPTTAPSRLDQKDLCVVRGKRDDTRDESFAVDTIA